MGVTFMFNPLSLTSTITKLGEVVLGTASATLDLSSIATGYKRLLIIYSIVPSAGSETIQLNLNGDSSNIYQLSSLEQHSSTITGTQGANAGSYTVIGVMANGGTVGGCIWIDNISTRFKDIWSQGGDSSTGGQFLCTGQWSDNTHEISEVTLSTGVSTYAIGSRMAVYGLN